MGRPLGAPGQRAAPHEDGAATSLLEHGKQAGRLGGDESRGGGLSGLQRGCRSLERRARARNVRGDGNGARRVGV